MIFWLITLIVSFVLLFLLTGLKFNWLNIFKTIAFAGLIIIAFWTDHAFGQKRPEVCKACFQDTTGGYISIEDTIKHNPICNYELLTKEHLLQVHQLKLNRAKIPFYPHLLDVAYENSGDSRGHVIPFEDLAYSPTTAKASMNLRRNLAPEPQLQNIGTELASENYERRLADSLGYVRVYAGTLGSCGLIHGLNKPQAYWKLLIEPNGRTHAFLMPTIGTYYKYADLFNPLININAVDLIRVLGFDPVRIIGK